MEKITRPGWDEYFLNIAKDVSMRSTCIRRRFGAVVVKHNKQISSGYCGAPKGLPNCIDIEKCFREEYKVPHGKNYNLCRSVHAEMNAIAEIGFERSKGSKLYLHGEDIKTGKVVDYEPCTWCKRFIIQGGIEEVIIRAESGMKRIDVKTMIEERVADPFKDQKKEMES